METIKINKTLNFDEGSIEFRYEGYCTKKDFDLNKIQVLIDDFMNNHNHSNMVKNVEVIRTILRDCNEQQLTIFYQDEKGAELVRYFNSNLCEFKKIKKENNSKVNDRYKIGYTSSGGIQLEYNNHEKNIADYSGIIAISNEITEIIKHIHYLKNVRAITLDRNSKTIIEIYKLFYNENPNFSSKDINIKIQTMMSILSLFGVSLDIEYGFRLWKNEEMPISLTLKQIIDKLYPFGDVDSVENNVKLAGEPIKIIKIVGKCIRESIKDRNEIEILTTISKVIYTGRYRIFSNSNINELAKIADCTPNEVQYCMEFVKRIGNKFNQQL